MVCLLKHRDYSCILLLAVEHVGCQLCNKVAVSANHSSYSLVGIVILILLYAAPFETVDDIVIETVYVDGVLAGIGVISKLAPVEWCNAVCQSLVHEEFLQYGRVVALAYSH